MLALPIFPGRHQPSIFGASELNCRVRYGNGWTLTAISTDFAAHFHGLYFNGFPPLKPHLSSCFPLKSGDPYESRTRVCGVRGRRLNHLTNGPCRRSKLRIFRFHLTAKTPSLRCFFSSNQTRLRWALIGVLRTFWGSHLGVPHT